MNLKFPIIGMFALASTSLNAIVLFSAPTLDSYVDNGALASTGVRDGAVWRYSDAISQGGTNFDVLMTIDSVAQNEDSASSTSINSTSMNLPSSSSDSILLGLQKKVGRDPHIVFTLSVVTIDTNVLATVNDITFQAFDIDTDTGSISFTDMFGYNNALTPTVTLGPDSLLEEGGWNNNGGVTGFTTYRMAPDGTGSFVGQGSIATDPLDLPGQQTVTVNLGFDTFSTGQFVVGSTGEFTATGGTKARGFLLGGFNEEQSPFIPGVPEPSAAGLLAAIAAFAFTVSRRK